LLECLIQIKGLADTPRRLEVRVRAAGAQDAGGRVSAIVARLATAEARFRGCLAQMLANHRPPLPPLVAESGDAGSERPLAEWLREFAARRRGTVEALDHCSADDLARVGIEPSRGPMTVADLVAVMFAHDTDRLGEILNP
jgi:hypothetical protein